MSTTAIPAKCPSTSVHGTVWAYRKHGCRHPEAIAKMRAKWRRNGTNPSGQVRHQRRNRRRSEAAAHIDQIAIALACRGDRVRLTRHELHTAIARLDTGRLSASQIAQRLHITERTVVRHRAARRRTTQQGVPGMSTAVQQPKTYRSALELIEDTVKATKSKADIAANVVDALTDHNALAPWGEPFTVHFGDTRNPTHVVEMPDGVTVAYINDTVIEYRFPAHAELAVA